MKHILLILTLISFFFSCKTDDLKKLKEKRGDLTEEINKLNAELKEVNAEIEKLEPTQQTLLVSVKPLTLEKFEHFVELQANVETDKDVMVYPEFAGVMNLQVSEGQYVSAGQVIAVINDGGLKDQVQQTRIQVTANQAQLQQAQAQADLARIAYQKQSKLWNQKIGSEIQYLQAKTNYEAAQKQVAALNSQVSATQKGVSMVQAQLARTAVRAPFSGVVDQVLTQNGQVVAPGVPIIRLVSKSGMKIEASVPETYISSVGKGTVAKINIPNVGEEIQSQISRVGSVINPANRTFIAEIPIADTNPLIKPNLLAKVKIVDYLNPSALVVPTNVIKEDDSGSYYVYILTDIKGKNAIAKKVPVTKGKTSGANTEIKVGLKAGERVIVEGVNTVSDGTKVKFQGM